MELLWGALLYILLRRGGDRVLNVGTKQDQRVGPSSTKVIGNKKHVAELQSVVVSGAENCGTKM